MISENNLEQIIIYNDLRSNSKKGKNFWSQSLILKWDLRGILCRLRNNLNQIDIFFSFVEYPKLLPSYKPNLSKDNISQKSQFSYSKGIISHIFQKDSLFSVQLGKADRYLCVLKNHSSPNFLCNGPMQVCHIWTANVKNMEEDGNGQ